jgi:hypothetical protein
MNACPVSRAQEIDGAQGSLVSARQVSSTEQVRTISPISDSSPANNAEYENAALWAREYSPRSENGSEEEIDFQPEEDIALDNPRKLEYRSASIESIKDELNKWAGPRGYCIVIQRSKKDREGNVKKVYLCCDRSRESLSSIDEEHRRRTHTASQRIQCPWACYLLRNSDSQDDIFWTLHLPNGENKWREHNHKATYTLASHISLRQQALRGEVGEDIHTFFQLKTLKPAEIYHTLHQVHDDAPIRQKDIHNLLYRWRKAQGNGLDAHRLSFFISIIVETGS